MMEPKAPPDMIGARLYAWNAGFQAAIDQCDCIERYNAGPGIDYSRYDEEPYNSDFRRGVDAGIAWYRSLP